MTNPTSSSTQGIDFRKALEILSERPSETHTHDENHIHTGTDGCQHNIPEEAKTWGQTIDLTGGPSTESKGDIVNDLAEKKKHLDEVREKRRTEIEYKLASMSVCVLLDCLLESQQQRVAAYKEYDRGLDVVLKTGNMTNYPVVCSEATATFSFLSETINAVRKALEEQHKRTDLAKLIIRLQKNEKEKLNLTAALHLERVRSHNEEQQNIEDGEQADKRITNLLKEGVTSLQQKISVCVEEINEILEEIRYALLEEREE